MINNYIIYTHWFNYDSHERFYDLVIIIKIFMNYYEEIDDEDNDKI